MSKSTKTRTRLSPEVRKNMMLDTAAEIIAAEGVSALNMERLGKESGVSKSLVYAYFPSMKDMLQNLLKREYKRLRDIQNEEAMKAETFEQIIRRVTRAYISYIDERGLILDRLAAEPSLAEQGDPTEYSRETAVKYLANLVHENFGIDMSVALPAVDVSFGLPAAAGHYLTRHDVSRQTIEDVTVVMILGAFDALMSKYELTLKPLKRSQAKHSD